MLLSTQRASSLHKGPPLPPLAEKYNAGGATDGVHPDGTDDLRVHPDRGLVPAASDIVTVTFCHNFGISRNS